MLLVIYNILKKKAFIQWLILSYMKKPGLFSSPILVHGLSLIKLSLIPVAFSRWRVSLTLPALVRHVKVFLERIRDVTVPWNDDDVTVTNRLMWAGPSDYMERNGDVMNSVNQPLSRISLPAIQERSSGLIESFFARFRS